MSDKLVFPVVNKVDGPGQDDLKHDFHALAMTPMAPVSAAHGRGFNALAEQILDALGPAAIDLPDQYEHTADGTIRIAA